PGIGEGPALVMSIVSNARRGVRFSGIGDWPAFAPSIDTDAPYAYASGAPARMRDKVRTGTIVFLIAPPICPYFSSHHPQMTQPTTLLRASITCAAGSL